jgi:uncharacterized protein (TIGR03437 family)
MQTRNMKRLLEPCVWLVFYFTINSASAQNTTADRVYGQSGSFETVTDNKGGLGPNSLYSPSGLAEDSSGGLYVADENNSRVLHFPSGSTTADRVYGQGGSFAKNAYNNGGISSISLADPRGIAVDSSGGIYVVDAGNHRVLHFPNGSTTADRVYGQRGSFTTGTPNLGGISANGLRLPVSVAVDSNGGIYVVDNGNNRVLHFSSGSTTADRVYGHRESFASYIPNDGGISASSLYSPEGVSADSSGGIYVADSLNHRVLHFPNGNTTADRVYGQHGSFSTSAHFENDGSTSANTLSAPSGLSVDSSGGIYVADYANNRVLHFPSGSTTADRVYGQTGSFTTNMSAVVDPLSGKFGVNANSLYDPTSVALDSGGGLYVADWGNRRVLHFSAVASPASTPISITANGIVNAASYSPSALAPGSLAAVFGVFTGTTPAVVSTFPWPITLSGVSVKFNNISAPLYYVSENQVNVQVPWELATASAAAVTVTVNGQSSKPESIAIASAAPGVFQTGTGQAIVQDAQSYRLIDGANPAHPGISYVSIYCTGLGLTTNQPSTGSAASASASNLSYTTLAPSVTIGDVPTNVIFSGLSPGYIGLYVIVLQVAAETPSGNSVPLVISVNGKTASKVTMAVGL